MRRQVKVDKALVNDQLQALQAMHRSWGVEALLASLFWILTKDKKDFGTDAPETSLVPFQMNRIQRHVEKNLARRNLLLKSRQVGGTTYFLLRRILLPSILEKGVNGLLISQNSEYAQKHFEIARRAMRYVGMTNPYGSEDENEFGISLRQNLLHMEYSNRRELVFDQLESKVMIASAEVEESGQGVTLHHILADEYSRWPGSPEATLSNVQGALVPNGTLDKNCTANGASGPFYEDCLRAMNDPANADAKLHFHGWWWVDEYAIDMEPKERQELEADLKADEIALIAKIHSELKDLHV